MTLKKFIFEKNKNYQFRFIKLQKNNKSFLGLIKKEKIDFKNFLKAIKDIKEKERSNFVFILRVLDFKLWEEKKNWQYKQKKGFFGLLERTKTLFKKDLKKIGFEGFKKIISPKESFQLAKKRYCLFKESLNWLFKNYDGNFNNYFEENKNPLDFCKNLFLLRKFQDFNKNFYFLKPNQLLYYEYILAKNFLKKYENFLEELTIFSDYKILQIFLNFGFLELPKKMKNKIENKKILKEHSLLVNELRWASIILGEKLSKELKLPSFILDNILWNLAHKVKLKIPHPRINTIFY